MLVPPPPKKTRKPELWLNSDFKKRKSELAFMQLYFVPGFQNLKIVAAEATFNGLL